MADFDKKAAQYRKDAAQMQSPTPTAAEKLRMQEMKEAADEASASEAAYNKASPIGKGLTTEKKAKGGFVRSADGCAQRGKTRGRMV